MSVETILTSNRDFLSSSSRSWGSAICIYPSCGWRGVLLRIPNTWNFLLPWDSWKILVDTGQPLKCIHPFPHCEVREWHRKSVRRSMISNLICTLVLLLSTGHLKGLWSPTSHTHLYRWKKARHLCPECQLETYRQISIHQSFLTWQSDSAETCASLFSQPRYPYVCHPAPEFVCCLEAKWKNKLM